MIVGTKIPALILAAGLATRLRPLSCVRAKGALPVAGEPLVRRVVRWLRTHGIADVVVNLHHLPHTLTAVLGDGSDLGVRIRYSWENPVLGSAGGPKRALSLLGAEQMLLVNGDTLTDLELGPLLDDHFRSGAMATLAVAPNLDPDKYSGLAVATDGAVTGVVPRGARQPSRHFFGVQVVAAAAFATVPDGVPWETVARLYPSLMAARPGSVRAYDTNATSLDIGTPSDYLETSLRTAAAEPGASLTGARATIAPDAHIERSILWDDVVVGAGVTLKECVVTDGVRVPEDTSWHGVTLRVDEGELAPGERRIGDLAVGEL